VVSGGKAWGSNRKEKKNTGTTPVEKTAFSGDDLVGSDGRVSNGQINEQTAKMTGSQTKQLCGNSENKKVEKGGKDRTGGGPTRAQQNKEPSPPYTARAPPRNQKRGVRY